MTLEVVLYWIASRMRWVMVRRSPVPKIKTPSPSAHFVVKMPVSMHRMLKNVLIFLSIYIYIQYICIYILCECMYGFLKKLFNFFFFELVKKCHEVIVTHQRSICAAVGPADLWGKMLPASSLMTHRTLTNTSSPLLFHWFSCFIVDRPFFFLLFLQCSYCCARYCVFLHW